MLSVEVCADNNLCIDTKVESLNDYGELELGISSTDLFNAGFKVGDLVEVSFLDRKMDMVISDQYPFIHYGDLFVYTGNNNNENIILGGRMRMFASATGVAKRVKDIDGKVKWKCLTHINNASVSIALKESNFDQIVSEAPKLKRTYNRDDYVSDQIYANFRMIVFGKIAPGVLYRSCSPIDDYLNRSQIADTLCSDAGIQTFLNLCDDDGQLQDYLELNDDISPYYIEKATSVINNRFYEDFYEQIEMEILGKQLTRLANSKPQCLIHCVESKDRTGFVVVLLECLMGASREEIAVDYVLSFKNYYGIDNNTAQIITDRTLDQMIQIMGRSDNIVQEADYSRIAYLYLKRCGMRDRDINQLIQKLKEY